ncbi:putative acyltransferase [Streptococcus constellatus]|uniref:Putative acyltransferase n=1 Tax=Streptococcus constellatus TaxID=76860 RepID=A0A564TAZ9_STRCV|nr:GNAT family N-acetyltransferase [Streptococcus constellatus]VUW94402.1 putative acyltransferase [Streptococcus gordonii]VUX04605.1 putative acyltransferase [Streptococcus constellatus]
MWYKKTFEELTTLEFYKCLKLRLETFVVEQKSVYNDLDENDLVAVHIFHENESEEVDAYARVFETGKTIHFGRIVTAASARGQGLGRELIQEIMETCAEKWPEKEIRIEAQEQVVGLYEKFGFEAISEPFILESRVHVTMIYKQARIMN